MIIYIIPLVSYFAEMQSYHYFNTYLNVILISDQSTACAFQKILLKTKTETVSIPGKYIIYLSTRTCIYVLNIMQ